MNKLFFAKYFRYLKKKTFFFLEANSNARISLFLFDLCDLYYPCCSLDAASQYRTWRKIHRVEKSKEDILFQNLITAFFSEVPSAWSHEWMSNASSWIKHVGACAPTLCPQVYRYLRTYNVWYDHSELVGFREKHERREREEIADILLHHQAFLFLLTGLSLLLVDYFFLLLLCTCVHKN